jgi:hypothetical protein
VWAPADKIQNGVSDLHVLFDQFYAIECKWVYKIPARSDSKLLQNPFTDKQLVFLRRINSVESGYGCGLIGLSNSDALLVVPSDLDVNGNITTEQAEKLFREKGKGIHRRNGVWDLSFIPLTA